MLELLQSQGWSDLTVITRKKVQRKPVWIVRGKPAVQEQGRKSWMFDVEDSNGSQNFTVFINEAPPRLKAPVTALLSRDPSERGKTLKSLLRARRARLSRPAAVESCEVGSAPDKEVGARGVGVTEAVTCLTKLVPPKDGVVDVDALPDEGMCA